MERVLERCAGLDVHKKTVTACVRVLPAFSISSLPPPALDLSRPLHLQD
jgi:hypothetical protein